MTQVGRAVGDGEQPDEATQSGSPDALQGRLGGRAFGRHAPRAVRCRPRRGGVRGAPRASWTHGLGRLPPDPPRPHDAEDAFQATFLVLARKASSIARREMVGNWLYAVAYKTALRAGVMASRRRAREQQVVEMPEPEPRTDQRRDDLLALAGPGVEPLARASTASPSSSATWRTRPIGRRPVNSAGRSGRYRAACRGRGRSWRSGLPGMACRSRLAPCRCF